MKSIGFDAETLQEFEALCVIEAEERAERKAEMERERELQREDDGE